MIFYILLHVHVAMMFWIQGESVLDALLSHAEKIGTSSRIPKKARDSSIAKKARGHLPKKARVAIAVYIATYL